VYPWKLLPSPQPLYIPSVKHTHNRHLEIKNWKLKTFPAILSSPSFLVNKLRFCDSGAQEWIEGSSVQEGGSPPNSISNSTKVGRKNSPLCQ
jgi:hypothetical protein